jgi:hypothetical protein
LELSTSAPKQFAKVIISLIYGPSDTKVKGNLEPAIKAYSKADPVAGDAGPEENRTPYFADEGYEVRGLGAKRRAPNGSLRLGC